MPNIHKILLPLLLLIGITTSTFAQGRVSVYFGIGGMYYIGELKPSPIPTLQTTKLCGHIGINYRLNQHFSLDLNYIKGSVIGDDKYALTDFRKNRNLRLAAVLAIRRDKDSAARVKSFYKSVR